MRRHVREGVSERRAFARRIEPIDWLASRLLNPHLRVDRLAAVPWARGVWLDQHRDVLADLRMRSPLP